MLLLKLLLLQRSIDSFDFIFDARQRRSQSCYQFDFTFTEVKGVSKELIYLATSLTRVKGEVKANSIFDLTFDACQKCSKSNFSSHAFINTDTRRFKIQTSDIGPPPPFPQQGLSAMRNGSCCHKCTAIPNFAQKIVLIQY